MTLAEIRAFERDHAACLAKYTAAMAALRSPRGRYAVTLASAGNPDFGQNPARPMPGVRNAVIRVATLRAASDACRLYLDHYELGSGNWRGGAVRDHATGELAAQISYNGRAWQPGTWPTPEITLEPRDP